ncbi:heavy-metal-associated domain-containing protein [Clostridium paraputrificum]|uniref:heavy-metal-associated domain-containing protein n=1 Tax=Clostridium paraputrificum TaxID=29363 RepID=UPI003D326AD8
MKSIIRVCDISKPGDVGNIQRAIASNEGVIACEISLEKKEVQIIYNESFLSLDKIIESIENIGYMVI